MRGVIMTKQQNEEEVFDLVDKQDRIIGRAARSEVHGNPALIHRVAHVLVFNRKGELFLQKRSPDKDVQPGKWDTSVGGHVDAGESYDDAALREMQEELGISGAGVEFLHKYLHCNEYESEYVCTYRCVWDGPFVLHPEEISEGRFWTLESIRKKDNALFTPNFLDELERLEDIKRA